MPMRKMRLESASLRLVQVPTPSLTRISSQLHQYDLLHLSSLTCLVSYCIFNLYIFLQQPLSHINLYTYTSHATPCHAIHRNADQPSASIVFICLYHKRMALNDNNNDNAIVMAALNSSPALRLVPDADDDVGVASVTAAAKLLL
jgi:hypothetical protein